MSNNTGIVATNVTCENTTFQLTECRKDHMNITDIVAEKRRESFDMDVMITNRTPLLMDTLWT
jgi:hypothetical protein